MSLLPSRDPAVPDAEPRVIDVDSEDADDVLSALSAETARKLLSALTEEPAPPGELADRVDTSLQNAQYHLKKLEAAGAVEVVDTAYSEKGREMDVYAPANQPLVICAGDQNDASGLRSALTNFVGGLAILAGLSLLVQELLGRSIRTLLAPPLRSGAARESAPSVEYFPNGSVDPGSLATDGGVSTLDAAGSTAASVAATIPPGAMFFAGGAIVLCALVAVRLRR